MASSQWAKEQSGEENRQLSGGRNAASAARNCGVLYNGSVLAPLPIKSIPTSGWSVKSLPTSGWSVRDLSQVTDRCATVAAA